MCDYLWAGAYDGAVEKLLELLNHPNSIVKSSAIMAFMRPSPDVASRTDPRVVPAFLKLMKDNPQHWVNGMILQALATLRDSRAVPLLLQMLAERQPAMAADGQPAGFGMLDVVAKPDRKVQQLCMTLAAIGDRSAIPALIPAQSDQLPDGTASVDREWFRRESFLVLLNIARETDLSTTERASIEDVSLSLLNTSDPLLQNYAIGAAGTLRSTQALPHLREKLRTETQDDELETRRIRIVLNALAEIDAAATHQESPLFLTHASADVRKAAVIAIGQTKHPQALPLLTKMLDDKDTAVLEAVLLQFGLQQDPSGTDPIIAWLVSVQEGVKPHLIAVAAQALGMMHNASATDVLAQLSKHDHLQIRINATLALVQLQDDRGVELLRVLLQHPNEEYRAAVMQQFAERSRFARDGVCPAMTLPAARKVLLHAAEHDPFRFVRHGGAAALYGLADDRAVECLLALTADRDQQVRSQAVSSLAATSNPVRAAVLKTAAQDSSAFCRIIAAKCYVSLHATEVQQDVSPVESAAALSNLLTDREVPVREAAVQAFARLQRIAPRATAPHLEQVRQLSSNDQSGRVRYHASVMLQSPQ